MNKFITLSEVHKHTHGSLALTFGERGSGSNCRIEAKCAFNPTYRKMSFKPRHATHRLKVKSILK